MTEKLEVKTCYACKETKPLTEFFRSNKIFYQKECKSCNRERKYNWYKTEIGKKSSANTKLKRRFGLTLEQYEEMYKGQNNSCAICGSETSGNNHRLAVDHCHTTNKIRGLLCKMCNVGLGNFVDSPQRLRKAAEYLENFQNKEGVAR